MRRFLALSIVLLLACGDSAPSNPGSGGSGGVGGSGGSGSGSGGSSSSTGGGSASSTTSGGMGGSGGSGGMAAGGAGGAGMTCPDILITDGMPAMCSTMASAGPAEADTTLCPTDSAVFWPVKVYEVPVSAGDCLYMQADNVGSPLGADLFGAIVDPVGTSILWDEELPCSVANPDGYACPAGGATMAAAGTAYVMVGAWEGAGCTPTEPTPYELIVAVNGVNVDLSNALVCAGDLQEIIP